MKIKVSHKEHGGWPAERSSQQQPPLPRGDGLGGAGRCLCKACRARWVSERQAHLEDGEEMQRPPSTRPKAPLKVMSLVAWTTKGSC
eukprot:1568194-Rhodomonas_salina.1